MVHPNFILEKMMVLCRLEGVKQNPVCVGLGTDQEPYCCSRHGSS